MPEPSWGAEAAAEGAELFSEEAAWDVPEEIPNDSAAPLLLLEHHWAARLASLVTAYPAASFSPDSSV
jgi:hypothetical protein